MTLLGVLAILLGGSGGGGRGGPELGVIIAFFVSCAFIYGFFALPLMFGQWLVDQGFAYGFWVAPAIWIAAIALNYRLAVRAERRRREFQ